MLASFKLAIEYAGSSAEEIVDVEAKNPSEAKMKCEEMVERNRRELERLASRNIYYSRTIRSCRMCGYDYKSEMAAVEEMLDSLEDNV